MSIPVSRRYARALVELAMDADTVEQQRSELDKVAVLFGDKEFQALSRSSSVSLEEKFTAVKSLLKPPVSQLTMNFVQLAIQKRLVQDLVEVNSQFEELAAEQAGILTVDAFSATPLDKGLVDKLEKLISSSTKSKKVRVQQHIDKSALGGIRLRIGDKLLDGTVQGALNQMKVQLG